MARVNDMSRGAPHQIALSVVDNLLEGCQVVGFDGTFRYMNDAAVAQTRRSREEFLGRTLQECHPGIEETPVFAALERCMVDRVHSRLETPYEYADGSTGWFQVRFVPVPEGVCILSLDLTSQRRTAEDMRRTHEVLRLLIEGVRDHAIYAIDPRGRVISWNPGAERLTGYSPDEIIGADFRIFYTPDDLAASKPDALLASALADGRVEDEGWRVRKDGTQFWANLVVTRLNDADGGHAGFGMITRDLTEYRTLEQQYRQAQKMEAVGRLAGGIAHDFNGALSIVLSYCSLLTAELSPTDPMQDDVRAIEAAGQRAAGITQQLLAFSSRQIVEPQVLDLGDIMAGMERMLRRLAGEDIQVSVSIPSDLGRVQGDRSSMEQAIMNLVLNARDAMPKGGRLTIELSDVDDAHPREHLRLRPGPRVRVAVSDTGIGMDRETQKHIFEPFFTTKEAGKGTGLGLFTVLGIVRQAGGSVAVQSEPGMGTTFEIYLPRTDKPVADSRPTVAMTRLRGSETVLLVEDDDQVRAVARRILAQGGYRVLVARSGGEALLLCEEHPGVIDLLLTDVVMPHMSGSKLAARLAPLRPEMRVLFMSGYTDNAIIHLGVVEAGIEFLKKPFTPDSLLSRVRQVLDAPRATVAP